MNDAAGRGMAWPDVAGPGQAWPGEARSMEGDEQTPGCKSPAPTHKAWLAWAGQATAPLGTAR